MNYRELGKTGIKVSEVSFGTWQLGDKGWKGVEGEDAIRLVHTALDEGCNLFDTAPPYGEGESEVLLGKALKGKREQVVLITKFGYNPTGPGDFSADAIRGSVERSLKTLQTDYLDGILLHNPEEEILRGEQGHYEVFEALKKEGKIRAYGASIDTSKEMNIVMDHSDSQICEIYFHAIHQEMALAFERASKEGMGLIGKVPLDSGWLTGKYNGNSIFNTGFRDRWTQEIKDRRANLVDQLSFLKSEEQTMAQGALRFILSHPEVSTVIPGAKSVSQLKDNLAASRSRLSQEDVLRIKQIWDEQIKDNQLPW